MKARRVGFGFARELGELAEAVGDATEDAIERMRAKRETITPFARTPDALEAWIEDVSGRGCQVFVAAAGGAAHLAGVVASKTLLPVLGVPMGTALGGIDSLLSTVQMPAGFPVATMAIGAPGARNAAFLAAQILATSDDALARKLALWREERAREVEEASEKLARES